MDERRLWPGKERAWAVLEVVGAGRLEDLHRSQDEKETGRKPREGRVEETGCRVGTEPKPFPGPEPEERRCCRRPSEPRGSRGVEEAGQEG